MKQIFLKTILVLVVFFLMFLFLEGLVRKFKSQITFADAQKLSLRCFASDDHLPFVLKKDSSCNMGDYYSEYNNLIHLNSLGYRGKEFSIEKPIDTKRILILGDSFTFGIGVNDEETYAAYTELALHGKGFFNTEVINAGYADAYSPDSYYVYLKNKGLALNPDVIVVGLFPWNDISDLNETVWDEVDTEGLPVTISSCCRVVDGDIFRNKNIPFRYAYPLVRDSQLFQLFVNTITKTSFFKSKYTSNSIRDKYPGCVLVESCIENFKDEEQKLYQVIGAIKNLADSEQIPLVIMIIPADYQFNPQAVHKYGDVVPLDPENTNFIGKRLTTHFKEMAIPTIDLLPALSNSTPADRYPYLAADGHFNSTGNKIAADVLSDYLVEHILSVTQ